MLNAVVNSTPVISLHDIGKLDILSKMYATVYIPFGVYEEVCIDGDISKSVRQTFRANTYRNFKLTCESKRTWVFGFGHAMHGFDDSK